MAPRSAVPVEGAEATLVDIEGQLRGDIPRIPSIAPAAGNAPAAPNDSPASEAPGKPENPSAPGGGKHGD